MKYNYTLYIHNVGACDRKVHHLLRHRRIVIDISFSCTIFFFMKKNTIYHLIDEKQLW